MTLPFHVIARALRGPAAFAAVYVLFRLPYWFIEALGGLPPPGLWASDYLIIGAALGYGGLRVLAFHPFYRVDYCAWLERTPWTSRKPLPLGPVHWTWQDGLIIGGPTALAWADSRVDPLRIAALPLIAHAVVLVPSLFATRVLGLGYATAFALALVVRLGMSHWEFLAAATAASLVADAGLRRSLAQFPWPRTSERPEPFRPQLTTGAAQESTACGWPHDQLRADLANHPRVKTHHAALSSALAGWWVFAVAGLIVPVDRNIVLLMILTVEAPALAILRLLIYRPGYAPPINLWGRLLTLRWIIPGYDQVYLGPLCTFLIPWPVLYAAVRSGLAVEFAAPVAAALTLFVALSCKPSLLSWRLTGRHRIVPTFQQRTEFVKVG
jgi:hypothetical protein